MKVFTVNSRNNTQAWIGRTQDGEYVALEENGRLSIFQPVYAEDTADNQNYITNVGTWDAKYKPLTKKDKAFLEDAYEANIAYCSECNIAHDGDYDYYPDCAFQWTDDGAVCKGECFAAYAAKNIDEYVDDPSRCLPLESVEAFNSDKNNPFQLKHIERFIGGMVDGRGGSFGGERVREGMPKLVHAELKQTNPNRRLIYTHDESGQFQTYWSVWELVAKPKRRQKTSKGKSKRRTKKAA